MMKVWNRKWMRGLTGESKGGFQVPEGSAKVGDHELVMNLFSRREGKLWN